MSKFKVSRNMLKKLKALVRKPSSEGGFVRRCQVVILASKGASGVDISKSLDLTKEAVSRIKNRFTKGGLNGLKTKKQTGRKPSVTTPENEARVVDLCLSPPPPGRSRWTVRLLGKNLEISPPLISKILRKNGLKPHLHRTYKVSRDPEFAAKVKDVVGLYLNPPHNAIVLSLDEKTQIQALERSQLPLPLRTGRAATSTHDYKRHGVVDLYAALEVVTGNVVHQVTHSHTSKDFIGFMKIVVKAHPKKELHVIVDNASTHKTQDVKNWMKENPRVHFHFTPTSASWLNQVEGFFGILSKQSLAHTSFNGTSNLMKHIDAYLLAWNLAPTPFLWTKPAKAIINSRKKRLI